MKNILTILLAMVLAFTLPLSALAENATASDLSEEIDLFAAELNGLVMGWTEEGDLLLRDEFGQMYQVHIDAELTNMQDAQFLAIGDYVTVLYDGRLSRSIPAQLTASYISCFQRTGVVTELVYDDGEGNDILGFIMAVDGEEAYMVDATNAVNDAPIELGTTVTVYFNGMMSRSIPAWINAMYTRTIHLAGQIVDLVEGDEEGVCGILLNDATFGEVMVWYDDGTVLYTELNVGEMITVATTGMMTMSIPAQLWAVEVFSMAVPAM